jgi:preprotein translocase subunit YajC
VDQVAKSVADAVALASQLPIFRQTSASRPSPRSFTQFQEFSMLVTPAYAQTGGGSEVFISLLPFILIFVIMYFLLIRPQRQQMKRRQEMIAAIRRGDTVVTGGGLVGKVTRVIDDNELEIDLGGGMKVTSVRGMIADVRVKGEPAANENRQEEAKPAAKSAGKSTSRRSTKSASKPAAKK